MSLPFIHRSAMLCRRFRASLNLYDHTTRIPNTTIRLRVSCSVGEANIGILQSTEEYKFVERLIPPSRVPIPPKHDGPSPSGWTPPSELPPALPYMIRRSRMHNVPVYTDLTHGSRKTTLVRKVEGDIWALEKDVNEVTMTLRVKGHFDTELKEWLVEKGF
uniref:Large ribosomal subunit protein mL49 n=1 Tax=Oncorhynchus tshawytscha TaxID=74940 RepID=A0A8C8HT36_ONCTS